MFLEFGRELLLRNVRVQIISIEVTSKIVGKDRIALGKVTEQGCGKRQTQLFGQWSEAGQPVSFRKVAWVGQAGVCGGEEKAST